MQALWIFDLDGTLVGLSDDYGYGAFRFGLLILDVFGHLAPYYPDLISELREIDDSLFPELGTSRERFPQAMLQYYGELCARTGKAFSGKVARRVYAIGRSALSSERYKNKPMIAGAESTLEFLLGRGDPVYCVTAGDPKVQWSKWRGYNLKRFFPTAREFRVVIKWDKTTTLKKVRNLYPNLPAFMAGDSINSDLVPAASLGITTIHTPHLVSYNPEGKEEVLPEGTIVLKAGVREIKERFREAFAPRLKS